MQTAHVVPRDDLIGHEIEVDCPCGPRIEKAWIDDESGWVVIHHALDGRELAEDA